MEPIGLQSMPYHPGSEREVVSTLSLGSAGIQNSAGVAATSRCRAPGYAWALLLARIYEAFPLLCPKCGGEMRIIAFITEAVAVRDILAHLGEPTAPPRMAPARGSAAVGGSGCRAGRV